MDNVVYVLGAGFSAPLGLPVMSNFLEMAHNIYEEHREEYPNFEGVFRNIKEKLAWITLFYKANLNNIEEVLSILEMERLVGGISPKEADEFHKFVIDVIKYFTPPVNGLETINRSPEGTYESLQPTTEQDFKRGIIRKVVQGSYGEFVLGLFNAQIIVKGVRSKEDLPSNTKKSILFNSFRIECEQLQGLHSKYSVVSLNYDLVLENLAEYYSTISDGYKIEFSRPQTKAIDGFPVLAKLHGSIDTNSIIPPTWNKTINEKIDLEWKAAYQLLSSANHIRFIGYSLPDSDAYIKYLLKSSIVNSQNLKRIDVICLDPDQTVIAKYNNFIAEHPLSKYRFANNDAYKYLRFIFSSKGIEEAHEDFFTKQNMIG